MTGPVVVGVDDFEHSDHLIATAVREAELRGTALWLAHAYHGYAPVTQGFPPGFTPEQLLHDAAEEQLTVTAAKVQAEHPDLHVETAAVSGPAAPALAQLANLASLLVVGGRGRGGLSGQLLGSVSLGTVSRSHCPVLVTRGSCEKTTQRVMLGLDVGQDPRTGPEVLEFAFKETARRNAHLYAFYVWEDPADLYAYGAKFFTRAQHDVALERGREKLETALAPWKQMFPKVQVTPDVLAGLPAKLLVEATDRADLVVIGGRAHEGKDGTRIGAIAHTVLHHADCPVAIVPEH
ncbi:universal stress protein [Catenulispora sp. NL8]|uniref:Universal stress protein n=1 Tax=Catenulispora pinistramenti TaxID=2705254 RepID=A0ABS5KM85_9ACTN|nr:universal stress protein [Catenulispora pinistramenti]MBS2547142.1 universal stress protein [Catenulispora pinistramenti]